MIKNQVLSDILQTIINEMPMNAGEVKSCYFRFGYWPEVNAILNDLAKDKTLELQRYPFVMLSAGWQEKREPEAGIYAEITGLNIFIVAQSDKNYSTEERERLIFQQVIEPIYRELIAGIKSSTSISVPYDEFAHTVTKLYYLRNMETNQNQLRNYVEVMQIVPEKLILNEEYVCQ